AAGRMRDQAFEQAKAASAQRAATSVAMMDSVSIRAENRAGLTTKRAGSHTFLLKDGAWTDVRPAPSAARTVRIKAYSKAYFDLIDAVPELKAIFAIGGRVTAQGRAVTVVVGESGLEELSSSDLKTVVNNW